MRGQGRQREEDEWKSDERRGKAKRGEEEETVFISKPLGQSQVECGHELLQPFLAI